MCQGASVTTINPMSAVVLYSLVLSGCTQLITGRGREEKRREVKRREEKRREEKRREEKRREIRH